MLRMFCWKTISNRKNGRSLLFPCNQRKCLKTCVVLKGHHSYDWSKVHVMFPPKIFKLLPSNLQKYFNILDFSFFIGLLTYKFWYKRYYLKIFNWTLIWLKNKVALLQHIQLPLWSHLSCILMFLFLFVQSVCCKH